MSESVRRAAAYLRSGEVGESVVFKAQAECLEADLQELEVRGCGGEGEGRPRGGKEQRQGWGESKDSRHRADIVHTYKPHTMCGTREGVMEQQHSR